MEIEKSINKTFMPIDDAAGSVAKPKTVAGNKVPAGSLSADPGPTPPLEGTSLRVASDKPATPAPVVIKYPDGRAYSIAADSPLGKVFTPEVIQDNAALAEIKGVVESLPSAELAKVMLPAAVAKEVVDGIRGGTMSGSDAIADLKQYIAKQEGMEALNSLFSVLEKDIAAIEKAVDSGTLHPLDAAAQIETLFEQIQLKQDAQKDKQFFNALPQHFNNDTLAEAGGRDRFVNTVQDYIANVTANASGVASAKDDDDKALAKDKQSLSEQVAQLQKELEAIRAGGPFNMATFVMAFTKALNDIRTLSNKIKAAERNATLTLQLASAEDTRQAGKERMKAALISGIMGICAGAISIVGSMMALGKANSTKDVAMAGKKESILTGKPDGITDLTKEELAKITKAGNKAFDQAFQTANSLAQGLSMAVKSSGDMGAGIMQMTIAGVEAEGKTHDAYAQGAASREDAAKKMADDMLQLMRDIISNQAKLNETLNSGVSSVIQRM